MTESVLTDTAAFYRTIRDRMSTIENLLEPLARPASNVAVTMSISTALYRYLEDKYDYLFSVVP
jgi:hypothetical protein